VPDKDFTACGAFPRRVHFIVGLMNSTMTEQHQQSTSRIVLAQKEVEALETWRLHSPGWTREVWSTKELRLVLPPEELAELDAAPNIGQKVDMARYLLLRRVGGIYADIDLYLRAPIDEMLGCDATSSNALQTATAFIAVVEFKRLSNYFFAVAAEKGQFETPRRPLPVGGGGAAGAGVPGRSPPLDESRAVAVSPINAIIRLARARMRQQAQGSPPNTPKNKSRETDSVPRAGAASGVLWATGPGVVNDALLGKASPKTSTRPNHGVLMPTISMMDWGPIHGVLVIPKVKATLYLDHHARGSWRKGLKSPTEVSNHTKPQRPNRSNYAANNTLFLVRVQKCGTKTLSHLLESTTWLGGSSRSSERAGVDAEPPIGQCARTNWIGQTTSTCRLKTRQLVDRRLLAFSQWSRGEMGQCIGLRGHCTLDAMRSAFASAPAVAAHTITMLRDPIARVLSEARHVCRARKLFL
jgi:hypothetical protein